LVLENNINDLVISNTIKKHNEKTEDEKASLNIDPNLDKVVLPSSLLSPKSNDTKISKRNHMKSRPATQNTKRLVSTVTEKDLGRPSTSYQYTLNQYAFG